MTKKTQANSKTQDQEKAKSLEEAKKQYQERSAQLEKWDTEKRYALKEELEDKDGNKTKVLILKTDQSHFIEMYVRTGQPFKIEPTGKDLDIQEDSDKLFQWLEFAVNIELTPDNMKKLGLTLTKARQHLSDFLLVWGLVTRFEELMES